MCEVEVEKQRFQPGNSNYVNTKACFYTEFQLLLLSGNEKTRIGCNKVFYQFWSILLDQIIRPELVEKVLPKSTTSASYVRLEDNGAAKDKGGACTPEKGGAGTPSRLVTRRRLVDIRKTKNHQLKCVRWFIPGLPLP